VLSGCLNSEVSRALSGGDFEKAKQTAGWYQEVFGRDHTIWRSRPTASRSRRASPPRRCGSRRPSRAGRRHQRLALPGSRPRTRPRGAPLHPDGVHAGRPRPLEVLDRGVLRESAEEWRSSRRDARGVPQHPRGSGALQTSPWIRALHLPKYVVPEGHTLETYLQQLARDGLRTRYGATPGDLLEARLAHELAVHREDGLCRLTSWSSGTSSTTRGRSGSPSAPAGCRRLARGLLPRDHEHRSMRTASCSSDS